MQNAEITTRCRQPLNSVHLRAGVLTNDIMNKYSKATFIYSLFNINVSTPYMRVKKMKARTEGGKGRHL